MYYRLYVFDNANRAIQSFDLIATELAAAAMRARRAMVDTEGSCGFELWQSAPKVLGRPSRHWLLALKETSDEQQRVA